MKNVVLVGFMGTGKTVIARVLARELDMTYVSIDDLIEGREKRPINDIFRDDGEPYFRKVEKEVVREVSEKEGQVVDAGGGVVLDGENMENLKRNGTVVCLWAAPEKISERTKKHGHRPLLNVDDPEGCIRELLDHRRPFYEKADHHIDTTELQLTDVVERIKGILNGAEKRD
ncbi:MAG: shikimate kinase [Candidatus Omnitrophota bacterium]|nr:shikimate kinase [Candidatus Omnitrophota bacterium]